MQLHSPDSLHVQSCRGDSIDTAFFGACLIGAPIRMKKITPTISRISSAMTAAIQPLPIDSVDGSIIRTVYRHEHSVSMPPVTSADQFV